MALGGSGSRRYAEALLDLAVDAHRVDWFRTTLEALRDAIGPDILRSLRDPGRPIADRLALVDRLTGSVRDLPSEIRALLSILVTRDRVKLFPQIVSAFGHLVDRRHGVADARVTTAVPLDDEQRKAFVSRLERISGRTIRAAFFVDPPLLGGAKVQVGDRLVDASVRAQLEELRRQLAS